MCKGEDIRGVACMTGLGIVIVKVKCTSPIVVKIPLIIPRRLDSYITIRGTVASNTALHKLVFASIMFMAPMYLTGDMVLKTNFPKKDNPESQTVLSNPRSAEFLAPNII